MYGYILCIISRERGSRRSLGPSVVALDGWGQLCKSGECCSRVRSSVSPSVSCSCSCPLVHWQQEGWEPTERRPSCGPLFPSLPKKTLFLNSPIMFRCPCVLVSYIFRPACLGVKLWPFFPPLGKFPVVSFLFSPSP